MEDGVAHHRATEVSFHRSIIGKGWVMLGTEPVQLGKTEEKASGAPLEGGGSHLNTKTRNAKEKEWVCYPYSISIGSFESGVA